MCDGQRPLLCLRGPGSLKRYGVVCATKFFFSFGFRGALLGDIYQITREILLYIWVFVV